MRIGVFELGHNVIGNIYVKHAICEICNEQKLIIGINSSESEYGAGCVCLDCFQKGINEYNNNGTIMADIASSKLKDIYRKRKEKLFKELAEKKEWVKKHLTYCNDRKCTHSCHKWNQIENKDFEQVLVANTLSDSFYVTPDPDEK